MGFGLGPKVMLEVAVVPDCTALMDAFDTLAAFANGETFDAPKAEIKDNKMSALITMQIKLFLFFIFLTFPPFEPLNG
jgi:hypothetical protein